eukprot:1146914-Pelagomonas_calceolata.AAC.15
MPVAAGMPHGLPDISHPLPYSFLPPPGHHLSLISLLTPVAAGMPHGLSDMHGGSMYGDEHGMDEDEDDDYDEEMPEDDEDEEQVCASDDAMFEGV